MLSLGNAVLVNGRPMTIDDLLAVKSVSDPQISPDGESRRLRGVGARPGHRQDQQHSLAGPHGRRRAETVDDRSRNQQPPALEPRRQDHRIRLQPRRLGPGLALARRGRRGAATDEAADRRLGTDLVAAGRQDRLHGRGLSRHDARADRGEGQGKGSLQEQGPHLRPPDDPALERLGRGEAEPPVRRRREHRRGPRPDAQARGQHAPCPVRRLVRLCLVARRQRAGLHRRAGQGPGMVHQHRHLDGPGRRRRAQEPDRGQPGRRRPARLLARRHDARLRQPGAAGLRVGPLGPARLEAGWQRDDRRQLLP